MNPKFILAYTAALLSIVISSPCRFASGIILMVFFNALIVLGTVCNYWVLRFKMDSLLLPLMIYLTVASAVAYKQLLILFSPVAALSTGFSLYVTAFCAYEIGRYVQGNLFVCKRRLRKKLKASLTFSAMVLGIFFIREFLGAGAVSFPAPQHFFPSGMAVLELPPLRFLHGAVFLASIPGTVILTAIAMTVYSVIQNTGRDAGV